MLSKKSLKDLSGEQLLSKVVLVRVDFNVPFENGVISDDARIRAALPTIQYLISSGSKVVLMSHLGQPKAKDMSFSLAPVSARLSILLGKTVTQASDCIGEQVDALVSGMNNSDIVMLENVRFHPEETNNDPAFSQKLASVASLFVQDAFGTAHRAHSSTAGVAAFLPGVAGFLVEKELAFLGDAISNPKRPLVAIIGGSKVSSKIGVLQFLLGKVDHLIVGGGMAFTFLKSMGYEIGKSLCEQDKLDEATQFLTLAKTSTTKVILPVDQVVVREFKNEAPSEVVDITEIPADGIGVDAGPRTVEVIKAILADAGTVLWNGPLGVFEMSNFSKGTYAVAEAMAKTSAITIVGGGDSASAIAKAGLIDKMTHVSTGGGASLAFLEGKSLPGIDVLEDR